MKQSFADILQGLDADRAQKVARKLPDWAAVDAERRAAGLDALEFPSALSLEQCSSTASALYKCALAVRTSSCQLPPTIADLSGARAPSGAATECQRDFPKEVEATELPDEVGNAPSIGGSAQRWGFESRRSRMTILDLTGGLGVDAWAFAQAAERVVYFERNAELAAAAGRNFSRLGADNIEVRCEEVTPQTGLPAADLIYADPARRDAAGRKVFLLEDCTPDILTLLPLLLRNAPAVLLKLSPMADLAMLAERLGPSLQEMHVVELDGEVKEVLCLLCRQSAPSAAEPGIVIVRLYGQGAERILFRMSEEREASAVYAAGVQSGDVLLEPCPALLKAGAFRLPCARWGLQKLAASTHLYVLPGTETCPGVPGDRFFKARRVLEVLPFGAAAFKALRRRYPRAEVTARNLPLGSDALRRKMGLAPGGDVHIFGCRLADGRAVLIATGR